MGSVYEQVTILESPGWPEPPRPLAWRSREAADELLTRLAVGYGALLGGGRATEQDAARLAGRDLDGITEVIEKLEGARLGIDQVMARARDLSAAFFHDDANEKALALAQKELIEQGSLTMHEVDFLVEAADGSDEALDDLARFRATFSPTRIPWPDHT